MPRRVITVSPAATRSPDAELISLIGALASSRSVDVSARANEIKKAKFADKLKQRELSKEGLDALVNELNAERGLSPSPEKQFLKGGGLDFLTNQLSGVADSQEDQVDPEVAQRKKAINDVLPLVRDTSLDFEFGPAVEDEVDIQSQLEALDARIKVAESIDESALVEAEETNIQKSIDQGLVDRGLISLDEVAPSIEPIERSLEKDTITPEEDSTIPEGFVKSTTLTDDPTRGPIVRGIILPEEGRVRVLRALSKLSPEQRQAASSNPLFKDLTAALGEKPLALQLLEARVKSLGSGDHLSIIIDDTKVPFLFDKFNPGKLQPIDIGSDFQKHASIVGENMTPQEKQFLASNYTRDEISGKVRPAIPIGGEEYIKNFASFLIDKDPERGIVLARLLNNFESAQQTKDLRFVELITNNLFALDSIKDTKTITDEAMRIMFLKLIEKNSAVLGQEFARIEEMRNIFGTFADYVEKMRSKFGSILIPEERSAIKKFAKAALVNQYINMEPFAKKYRLAAKAAKVNPDAVVFPRTILRIKEAKEFVAKQVRKRKGLRAREKRDKLLREEGR